MYPIFVLHYGGGTEGQSSLSNKKKTEREQRLWLVEIHDQGNLVDQKDELPGQSWHGERLVL